MGYRVWGIGCREKRLGQALPGASVATGPLAAPALYPTPHTLSLLRQHFGDDVGAFGDAEHEDQSLVENPPPLEIEHEPGKRLVEGGQKLIDHSRIMVPVRIPGVAREAVFIPEDADQTCAGLDHPPRRQARLSEQRHAVQ